MKYEPFYSINELLDDQKSGDQWLHEISGGNPIIAITKDYLRDFLKTTGFVVMAKGTGNDFNEAIRNVLKSEQHFDLLTSERILVSIAINKRKDILKTMDLLNSFFSEIHQEKIGWGLSINNSSNELRVFIMGVNPNQKNS